MSDLHAKGLEAAAQIAEAFADSEELEAIAGLAASTGVHSAGWLKDALHSHGQEVARKIAEAIRAALSNAEPAAPAGDGEPVAWQWRARALYPNGLTGEWSEWNDGRRPAMRVANRYETEERPLYTRPQPAADVVEALRRLRNELEMPERGVLHGVPDALVAARAVLAALEAKGAGADDVDQCPICAKAFEPTDLCATDVELGTCHAACLEGSPVVDLETGEPSDGPVATYRYDEAIPAPQSTHGQESGHG